jgi:hypothetical protein
MRRFEFALCHYGLVPLFHSITIINKEIGKRKKK